MNKQTEIGIIGGGLAGLIAAIHLLKQGISVTVFEKNTFPKHKVCGEFISNEVYSYLNYLGLNIASLHPATINTTLISNQDGKSISAPLEMGGFGVSRFTLDSYLADNVIVLGGEFIKSTVSQVNFKEDNFIITTENKETYQFIQVLGAFGKRSNLDTVLQRKFIQQKSPWLAVKMHYSVDYPSNLVGLYNFNGGYCGVSQVENKVVNICYLVHYKVFKKYKNIEAFQENVLYQNQKLKAIFTQAVPLFEKPLTISQVSFENKPKIENHMLMIGDTAGLIHPLCGNGMAMAIHSAKIASELVISFLKKEMNRDQLERSYSTIWNQNFRKRIQFGKLLSKIMLHDFASKNIMNLIAFFPSILSFIIKKTHGKELLDNI
ncbi:NAD(P)-binding protein [Flavobacterium sp. TP390]|uniref:NAD(P)-binding protein n=1 Tax=Flavobacterium profundi TaxID=1774945 RepID=A0A6I4IF58_9FLAO|nr:FAD-dependent oxidoreductase [Flavobacterium profundi]MVO08255.1 NAD(P)-binding protein [Flavobacterium profundi]